MRLCWENYPQFQKQFKKLSDIHINESVEYYISSDLESTEKSFCARNNTPFKNNWFEVLIFDWSTTRNMFIKYPNSEHFIELNGGAYGSSSGTMITGSGSNVWEKQPWSYNLKCYRQGNNMMLEFGSRSLDFNFLTRVAKMKTEYIHLEGGSESQIRKIEHILETELYLPLPNKVVNVVHAYKLFDNPKFQIIITHPAFDQNYFNPNIYTIDSTRKGNVIKLHSCLTYNIARDGGSTWITCTNPDNDDINNFYRPTPFNTGEDVISTWNDNKLKPLTQKEEERAIKLLNLIVEEKPISYDSVPHRKR